MARSRRNEQKKVAKPRASLAPGLHAGRIELKSDDVYRVRMAGGERLLATLADEVSPALAQECLRDARTVIVVDTERGPTIVGALQVSPIVTPDAAGTLTLDARTLRLRASRGLSIEVGDTTIALDAEGVVRMEGDRLVIDMAQFVKVASARMDIP
jgi:hypothetical protein